MRIIPVQAMYKPNSSTVKNNYPKNVVDSQCSTVVELSSRKSIGLYNRSGSLT